MKIAALPENESMRLNDLYASRLLDTPAEADFDELVELAAYICKSPISLISLLDKDRQWFKAKKGIDITSTPRDVSICSHVILQDEVMVVPDPSKDERFFDNPLVTGPANVRFYAGAPIVSPAGHKLGTLCIIDHQPREFSPEQEKMLSLLAKQASKLLEIRKKNQLICQRAEEIISLKSQSLQKQITGNEQGKRAISHNLHEGLAQSVASSIFYLDAVGEDAQKNNVLLQQVKKQMQQVLNEVRNLSHRISPPGLSILSAGELVKEFIEKSTAAYPFSITVYEKNADRTLQPEILLTGIRMLEEWLGMLAIHTKPASVMVKIQCRQRLLITISDDDTALQKEEREKQALQFSFADRAESLGGEVVLSQTKAGHHAICFGLPLQVEAQPAVKSFSALVG